MKLATLCYVKQNDRTLMMHRIKKADDIHKGKWNGLGGKLEPGESPEQCIVREVREEAGLEIVNPRYHGLLVFADFKAEDWYVFVFTARQFAGSLVADSAEGKLEWVRDEKLLALPLWPSDQIFIPWLAGERIFSARFQYRGEAMLEHAVSFY
jgi:8-oxo-dGTP diphosphatase